MTGEYKKLAATVASDPKLKGRVVIAKVRWGGASGVEREAGSRLVAPCNGGQLGSNHHHFPHFVVTGPHPLPQCTSHTLSPSPSIYES